MARKSRHIARRGALPAPRARASTPPARKLISFERKCRSRSKSWAQGQGQSSGEDCEVRACSVPQGKVSVEGTCKVRAVHTCRSLMPKRNSTSCASRGYLDPLEPAFPASEANWVAPGELPVGWSGHHRCVDTGCQGRPGLRAGNVSSAVFRAQIVRQRDRDETCAQQSAPSRGAWCHWGS